MKEFLKENIVLVAGIALPLLLTVIFFVATTIDSKSTADAQFKVLYLGSDNHSYNRSFKVIIKNKQAYLSYVPPANSQHRSNANTPNLYLFDPVAQKSSLIDLPYIEQGDTRVEKLIEEISHLRLSGGNLSPDGYKFERSYRRSGNLMTELFGGGYRGSKQSFVLRKENKVMEVPNATGYNTRFVAWVIAEK